MKTPQKTLLALAAVIFLSANAQATMFWARPYDPNLQRWITRDPIEEEGGINLYAYVDNDPIDFVDPWGLDILPINDRPDPFCAVGCDKQLSDCINTRTLISSLGGAAAGAGAQAYNKTGQKPPGGVAGGGPSGRYTSRTRLKFGRGIGRTIGRLSTAEAGLIGAGVADLVALASCQAEYGRCLSKCPRASNHPPCPLNLGHNAPPDLGIFGGPTE